MKWRTLAGRSAGRRPLPLIHHVFRSGRADSSIIPPSPLPARRTFQSLPLRSIGGRGAVPCRSFPGHHPSSSVSAHKGDDALDQTSYTRKAVTQNQRRQSPVPGETPVNTTDVKTLCKRLLGRKYNDSVKLKVVYVSPIICDATMQQ